MKHNRLYLIIQKYPWARNTRQIKESMKCGSYERAQEIVENRANVIHAIWNGYELYK